MLHVKCPGLCTNWFLAAGSLRLNGLHSRLNAFGQTSQLYGFFNNNILFCDVVALDYLSVPCVYIIMQFNLDAICSLLHPGESFHLVLVNDSDSDSATNIAVMTNNTAAADILRDDPTDPNADPTDPSADPTDTTEQLARPDDPRLSEDDRNTPLYHTLEPNRECKFMPL